MAHVNLIHMTNNTQQPQQLTETEIRNMKRDELRKYASQLGIKNAAKMSRDNLTIVVIDTVNAMFPSTKIARVRTSHADCDHASTKVARAKCRRERNKS